MDSPLCTIWGAVDRETASTVQTRHKRVAAGFVGADFFALIEGKKGHAHGGILGKSLAHDLTFLVGDLVFERQNFGLADAFFIDVTDSFSRIKS